MSEAIKIMMKEHLEILKVLKIARNMCKLILKNNKCETEDFIGLLILLETMPISIIMERKKPFYLK